MANTEQKSKSFVRLYRIALIGILTAIAVVLMMFEFPLLWIAPGFYKMDFSELPIIIGALALGPVEGIVMEFLKNLLNILLQGTVTVGIGEFANFAMGVCYVLPAALIYAFKKTKKRAVIGLIIATFMCAILGALLNAFVLLPAYASKFGGMDNIIKAGTEVNGRITSVATFVFLAVAPFNLIKYATVSAITILIYKRISRILKNPMERA